MAERLEALVLTPRGAETSRCRFCFSLQPPSRDLLRPAVELLRATGRLRRVVYIADEADDVSRETCGALPNLTGTPTVAWTVEQALRLDSVGVPLESDVWVLCARHLQCLVEPEPSGGRSRLLVKAAFSAFSSEKE
ncbi:unnamed protein product [Durusdinium trenchii]|uniref:Uncharacterized protein n=1 Tax=Durusdinium trenchii TaxID=1381693 RepID=A0ABP0QRG4_9DINO